jgi:GntR family transcriptional regulator, rspAB operon transcriptional repressor
MNKRDLPTEVYSNIRSRILNFLILPGMRISDRDIAQELGLSRTPVREALIRLAGNGLVQVIHNRGFSVRQFTIKEVRNIYSVREALELLAISLVIERMDVEISKSMKSVLHSYRPTGSVPNINEFNKADEDFHQFITKNCDNELLENQLNSLRDQLAVLRRYAHLFSEDWRSSYEEETYEQHRAIYEHMVQGNVEEAKKAASVHIKASMDSVIDALENQLSVEKKSIILTKSS